MEPFETCDCHNPQRAHGYMFTIYGFNYGESVLDGTETDYFDSYRCKEHGDIQPPETITINDQEWYLIEWSYTPIKRVEAYA